MSKILKIKNYLYLSVPITDILLKTFEKVPTLAVPRTVQLLKILILSDTGL